MDAAIATASRRLVFRSIVVVVVLIAVSMTVGFVLLPGTPGELSASAIWASICRAAGVPGRRAGDEAPAMPSAHATTVVLDRSMTVAASSDAVGRGSTLALQCTVCHGAAGAGQPNAPGLAGQASEVIVKQLLDFQHGDRSSAIMQALTRGLPARDITDLAAYYASLPRPSFLPSSSGVAATTPSLVSVGDPMRNVAPCAACHGDTGRKLGAPRLQGMPSDYLRAQLTAFATGTRTNDSHAQMRNMVRSLTPTDIAVLSAFYATGDAAGAVRSH